METVFCKSVLLLVLTTISATAQWNSPQDLQDVPEVPHASFYRACHYGFEHIGEEGGELVCGRIQCPPLPSAYDSHRWFEVESSVDKQRPFEHGSVYELRCAGGFRPNWHGLERTTCIETDEVDENDQPVYMWDKQEDDEIDEEAFGCAWGMPGKARGCGWTPSIANAKLASVSKEPVRVYYKCDKGYKAVGPTATHSGDEVMPTSFYMECSDDTQLFDLDSPEMPRPRCARMECPHLFNIENGEAKRKFIPENAETNFDFGAHYTIECNRGHHILENPGVLAVEVKCTANRKWKSISHKVTSSDYTRCVGGSQ